jgi:AraC-like DNA-binding protein
MMEISYLARGTQNYWLDDRCFRMSGGDLFVTYPDEKHSTGPDPEHCGIMYWLILELPPTPEGFLGLPDLQARAYWEGVRSFPHRHCCAGPEFQPLLERIFRADTLPDPGTRLTRMHLGILAYLLEITALAQRAPARSLTPAIATVLAHIERHLGEPLKVEALAQKAELSLPRFKARFRAETGFPPAEYVLRKRIELASKLLARSETTVLDVALETGFCSSQYFASAFRRITGFTPTLFRERMRTTQGVHLSE